MQTMKNVNKPQPILMQVTNNTIFWVGHRPNEILNHYAGQTFISPVDNTVDNIQIYADMVHQPGDIMLTLHSFDDDKKIWGPGIGSATVSLTKDDKEKWIQFELLNVNIKKGNAYGFRLQSSEALVAVGEAAGGMQNPPFATGLEWSATSNDQSGHFFRYFSLAFKIEVC